MIPEGTCGAYSVVHRWTGSSTCALLRRGEQSIMNDDPSSRVHYQRVLDRLIGDVLVLGLGIGFVPSLLLPRPDVRSVTAVEVSPEVIRLVRPHLPAVRVYRGDAWTWEPVGGPWHAILMDVWQTSEAATPQIEALRAKYAAYLRDERSCIVSCWD